MGAAFFRSKYCYYRLQTPLLIERPVTFSGMEDRFCCSWKVLTSGQRMVATSLVASRMRLNGDLFKKLAASDWKLIEDLYSMRFPTVQSYSTRIPTVQSDFTRFSIQSSQILMGLPTVPFDSARFPTVLSNSSGFPQQSSPTLLGFSQWV